MGLAQALTACHIDGPNGAISSFAHIVRRMRFRCAKERINTILMLRRL